MLLNTFDQIPFIGDKDHPPPHLFSLYRHFNITGGYAIGGINHNQNNIGALDGSQAAQDE
jgi:hypothetical protein